MIPSMLNDLSAQLTSALTENVIYLTVESDLTDFRKNTPPKLKVNTSTKSQVIELPKSPRMGTLVGLLSVSLFGKNNVIIGWNLKDLFSWLRFHSGMNVPVNCKVFDLKLIEAFSDEFKAKPATYDEAVTRLRAQMNRDEVMALNKYVYSPLLTTVIPAMETAGLVVQDPPARVYSSYTIEGQANGRLNSGIPFSGAFNPHNLTEETKNNFYPGMDRTFLTFDFRYLEVILLQWITKDEKLGEIVKSGEDVYAALYKQTFGASKCSPKNRDLMKKVFIQVIYGIQANSLAEQIGISVNGAQSLIDKILETFPKAFGHLNGVVELAKSGSVLDVMGRKSVYQDKYYTARNAVIQGPAAMVCLEKLCDLYGLMLPDLTIVASIHDACICTAPKATAMKLARACADVLKSESKLAPGLCLDVTTKMGEKWGNAETIKFDETNEEDL